MSLYDTNVVGVMNAKRLSQAIRVDHGTPLGIRWAIKPGAVKVLQCAYRWERGSDGGVEWRDVETVNVEDETK